MVMWFKQLYEMEVQWKAAGYNLYETDYIIGIGLCRGVDSHFLNVPLAQRV